MRGLLCQTLNTKSSTKVITASIKILEKNGFIQTAKFDEIICYVVDLNWVDL
jgi:hypothetical protein